MRIYDPNGRLKDAVPTTVAKLPAMPNAAYVGVRLFVTDCNTATFNAAVGAGGANAVPVFCDGTTWKVG